MQRDTDKSLDSEHEAALAQVKALCAQEAQLRVAYHSWRQQHYSALESKSDKAAKEFDTWVAGWGAGGLKGAGALAGALAGGLGGLKRAEGALPPGGSPMAGRELQRAGGRWPAHQPRRPSPCRPRHTPAARWTG
jgi:hypothetical protein